jgi:hypothetical protein
LQSLRARLVNKAKRMMVALSTKGKIEKCFYFEKLWHISKVCRDWLWDEKHNPKYSSNDQSKKKHANVVEHEEEELCDHG